MPVIDVELEEWTGSPVIRDVAGRPYSRWPAAAYKDKPAKLTKRQATFHENLRRIALATGSPQIPVDFFLRGRGKVYLDHGCIKIAEHAGFIKRLENGPEGVVEYVELAEERPAP
jgi:hypothetical protein